MDFNEVTMGIVISVVVALLILLFSVLAVLPEYERGVVLRLGRALPLKGPGLIVIIPVIDRLVRVPMRTIVLDVPKQDVITRDNVSATINAVVYYRVMDPLKAVLQVQDFHYATAQLAQTTLLTVAGEVDLDDLLAKREQINLRLQQFLDKHAGPWGIKVNEVEIKDIDLPAEMKRAMARQAEAERERRAKIIAAEGELQASVKLAEASLVMEKSPVTIQLRYLQALREVAAENNSTTLFPIPIELFAPFLEKMKAK